MKPISFLLLVLLVADIITDCVLDKLGTAPTRYLTKGLVAPLLIAYFVVEVKHETGDTKLKGIRFIILALIFSFIGDLFFVNIKPKINFACGLGFFAVAAFFYSLFFYTRRPFIKKNAVFLFFATLIILGYAVVINYIFWGKMYYQNLIAPVVVYFVFAGFMLLTAVNVSNSRRLNQIAVIFLIPGAACFIAAHTMLGFNRFYLPRPLAGYYTEGIYGLAQLLMVAGSAQILKNKKLA